jgi:RecB family exonuclease
MPIEIERGGARLLIRVDRHAPAAAVEPAPAAVEQLELFEVAENGGAPPEAPALAPLAEVPAPPLHRVRRLSYSALSLFERCSYRYFAERVVGLRPADAAGSVPGQAGLAATEIGDAVHALLERIDLRAPAVPQDLEAVVRARYPAVTDEELERIRGFVASYCGSELGARIAGLEGAAAELPFAFEHDGVLLHGRIDVLHREGASALVLDYKTNSLSEGTPEGIVEHDYNLQRLVYALACFRAGAEQVEVVYHFLERPDAVVTVCYKVGEVPALEAELSAAIAQIQAGEFRPTPDEFVCADCPALNLVCAGPRLRHIG